MGVSENMKKMRLTTYDNPYDPFDDFPMWLAEDIRLARKYDRPETSRYLARICKSSYELSDADQLLALESAIDEIISLDPKTYKKVYKTS